MRELIDRKTGERHLLRAAEFARTHEMKHLKLYLMVGLPDETDDDIDELCALHRGALAHRRTLRSASRPSSPSATRPSTARPSPASRRSSERLDRLRRGLRRHAEVRPTSARWAWVEYVLAQGGMKAGLRALRAHQAGGSFAAWRDAFSDWEEPTVKRALRVVA